MSRRAFEPHLRGSYTEVWHLAYPAVMTMLSQTMMSFADAAMVGRLGAAELAGVGLAGTLVWGIYSFFNGLVNGVNTFVAQDYGAQQYKAIGVMTWQGIYFSLISGVAILLLGSYSRSLFALLGPAPEVQAIGTTYARIRMAGGVFVVLWMCFSSFLRGLGDTRTPLKVTIIANIINIFGDYVLIFGKLGFPKLGIEGAAIATVLANLIGTIYFFVIFISKQNDNLYGTRSNWRPNLYHMKRLARIGVPIGVQWVLDMGGFIVFSAIIGRIGTAELAASEAALRLMSLSFMPVYGFSIAATTLVGQYIGANEHPLAVRSGNTALRLGMYYTLGIACLFLTIPGILIAVINSDPKVVAIGKNILRLVALFQVFDGIGIVCSGCLRGAGDTRWTMYVAVGYAWLIFVPLAYAGGFLLNGGAFGAWAGATAYIIALGVTFYWRFKSGKWRSIKL